MIYIVDRIEDDIVVLENRDTREIIDVKIEILPNDIQEGSVLIYDNGKYKIDLDGFEYRRKEILEKFLRLRKTE